jgi:hypothetical protein
MMSERIKKALELVEAEYAELTDENNPYHGGIVSRKIAKRYKSVIDKMRYL